MSWKCANCGNTDKNSLFDEGDTFYCSICTHRTVIATGKDDLIICPWCKRLRDRKAAYCDWCNNQINLYPPLTKEEMCRTPGQERYILQFVRGTESELIFMTDDPIIGSSVFVSENHAFDAWFNQG